MKKIIELETPEQSVVENAGDLSTEIEEASSQSEVDKINNKLLEQINYKLDLLLSNKGE